jgi:hypothetical protein
LARTVPPSTCGREVSASVTLTVTTSDVTFGLGRFAVSGVTCVVGRKLTMTMMKIRLC